MYSYIYAALSCTLQDIQSGGFGTASKANSPSSLHVSVHAPHICALILLPAMPAGASTAVPSCHGNSYMAVDFFAAVAAPLDNQVIHCACIYSCL